jgi:hypothetical protein
MSTTYFETSTIGIDPTSKKLNYLDNINFDHSFFWRRRYNKEKFEKDSYFFHSLYLKDSVAGVKLIGFDFNFMHEPFEKNRMNVFRKWNIIRAGLSLSVERNPFNPYLPLERSYEYINASVYVKYYHIPKASRGDKTTKYRRWAWGFWLEAEYFGRFFGDLHIKTGNYLWVHARFRQELNKVQYAALIFEWELNKYAYEKCRVQSTKDTYNGVTFLAGLEYNMNIQTYMLNVGLNMRFRNH